MFDRTAHLYDLVYERGLGKDYEAEAALVASHLPPHVHTLLDVACGTGLHLQHLAHRYDCTGTDLDPGMLAIARERCPDIPLVEADMAGFDLGRTFDAVVCLFSSIGYVRTEARLHQTAATFARHLAPGGTLLVELWLTPEAWVDGHIGMLTVDLPDVKVCRMNRSWLDDGLTVMEFSYLVGRPGSVEHLTETHVLGLFTFDQYRGAFEDAGFEVTIDPTGSAMGRGLLTARKPV